MSEYQYYEFAALDRALDPSQLAALRGISTRAQITPTSFVNTYEWGDLRADPGMLVERYFDAFLYLSNWGTHRLTFRLPSVVLDTDTAAQYCVGDAASWWQSGAYTIVDLVAQHEDGTFEEDWSLGAGEGRLTTMVTARSDLLAGDRRVLYLAWLLCVQAGEVAEDAIEPVVPLHLGDPTGSLSSVATFLRVDQDLLTVAAEASVRGAVEATSADELNQWLAGIPTPDQTALLARVAHGSGGQVQAELRARFARSVASAPRDDRRTAGKLLASATSRRLERERAVRRRRARNAASQGL